VNKAQSEARNTIEKLYLFTKAGIPIVGLEPSCLLSMRDEYFSLLPDDERVKTVAAHCFTFEEFIAKLVENNEIASITPTASAPTKAILHGHCHQKSLVGTKPSHRMLQALGFQVEEVDSGCCGMAGSFGYEKEHFDISQKMAERRLMPAIRANSTNSVIVAAGTSCRHQIAHFTGQTALHPAEVLRNHLQKGQQ
jgi:Fe-S oxidoreductase